MIINKVGSMKGSRSSWRLLFSANTDTSALTDPAFTATKPATNIIGTGEFRLVRLVFAGTDAADETINYQVIGWQRYKRPETQKGSFWIPRLLATGVATLGTKQLGAAGADIEGAATYIADTITETKNLAGTIAISPANNTMAILEIETASCDLIEVQVDRNTAATADVIYSFGDGIW